MRHAVLIWWCGAALALPSMAAFAQDPKSAPPPPVHRVAAPAARPGKPQRSTVTRPPPSWGPDFSSIPWLERPELVAMAACSSVACVRRRYGEIAAPDTVARILLYSTWVRLRPRSRAASCGLWRAAPRAWEQYSALASLDQNLYPGQTDAQIDSIARAFWRMSRDLANALKLCPRYLPAFIVYGRLAIRNSHDDYPDWAARVCGSNPGRFLRAFETLAPGDRRYVSTYIIDPRTCRQIASSEAR